MSLSEAQSFLAGRLADTLFGATQSNIERDGSFMPVGAVAYKDGEVRLVSALPTSPDGGDTVLSTDVLVALHGALRAAV